MIDCIIPLIHFASRTQAALAGAVTMLRCLPEKLNPVIKPLMESIKKEDNEQLQVC
jgi:TATA-binding protein-associated factor